MNPAPRPQGGRPPGPGPGPVAPFATTPGAPPPRRPRLLLSAFLTVLVAAFALIGLSAVPAAAHAEVVSTTPADGTSADQAPATVSVRFSEAVQVTPDGIRVLAADGTRVDRGDAAPAPGQPGTVSAALRSGLGPGAYTVAWNVTSADSHPVHGAFTFAVGQGQTAGAPLAGADRGADPTVTVLVRTARGAGYLGLALLVGAAGMSLLLDGAAGRSVLAKQIRIGGLTLTLSAALSLLAQGPYAAGTGPGSLLDPDLLHTTLSGRTGIAEALRVVLAAGLTLAVSDPRPAARPASSTPRSTAPDLTPADLTPADTVPAHTVPADPVPADPAGSRPDPGSPALVRSTTATLTTPDLTVTDPVVTPAGTADPTGTEPVPVRPAAPPPPRVTSTRWSRPASYAVFVPLLALAATFSATGHPVAGRHVPLAFTADLLHLMAMGLWLGGLAALVALVALCGVRTVADGAAASDVSDRPATPDASPASDAVPSLTAFTTAVRRFSPLAAWCVGVLAVTGTVQSIRDIGSVGDLPGTAWGRYLLVKLAVVLALLAVAHRARGWTHRHAARRAGPAGGPAPAAGPTATTLRTLRTLRRTLAVEALAGAVVLTLSVLLAGSPPPSDRPATTGSVTQSAPASPARLEAAYDTGGVDGRGTAVAVLTPQADGRVAIDLTLTATDDIPVPAQPAELTATMSLPAQGIGPLALDIKEDSTGHWTASATPTPRGSWQLALTIRTSDIDQTTVTFPATTL
jgi:copper transport protein